MRVTGGSLRGRRLRLPRGGMVRPAGGRVRQAVFNLLGQNLAGAVVLDLYAGTGIFGIEALSRGAAKAFFVEKDPGVAKILSRNIEELGLGQRATIYRQDVNRFLKNIDFSDHQPVTLVFLDPPFYQGRAELALSLLQGVPWLAPGGRVVVKHSATETMAEALPRLRRIRWRRYGSTDISLYLAHPPAAGTGSAGEDARV